MRVLVVNPGSSSLKLSVVGDGDEVVAAENLAAPEGTADPAQLSDALHRLHSADAVGYRFVHGGPRYTTSVVLDEGVLGDLARLADLAPIHQRAALAAVGAVTQYDPGLPSVACFDTAFHASLPAAAMTYALPSDWRVRFGLRRYGFHGLSHAWASRRAATLVGSTDNSLRVVTCHLGSGASLAAVRGGRSVDTTMGFTPLDGLVMATRAGSVDPGLLVWLAQHGRVPVDDLANGLEHRSGLVGLAGTPDMRAVTERAGIGDPDATLALEVYLHRLRAGIAAMAAALGGSDALVFTGGVGEHSAAVRAGALQGMDFLDLTLDPAANATAEADADISAAGARVRVLVIAAREDLIIAEDVRRVLATAT